MSDSKNIDVESTTVSSIEPNDEIIAMGSLKSKLKKSTKPEENKKENEEMEIAGDEHSFMCGVVEGFYGRPWTAEQRKELFRRMEEMGLNTYLYAPKDDYKHRLFWREKYSTDESELLKSLIQHSEEHNVVFVYAISPGLDMIFTSEKEITALKEKLLQVKKLGCKAFALLFDDIDPVLCALDLEEFDSSADAQASITNLMFNALDKPRFIFCPTEYCSSMAVPDVSRSSYLKTLGVKLDPLISVMWTGSKVVSNIISANSIKQVNRILKRKVMIWDNIHANDYDPKRVFLGPYKGRSTNLVPLLSGVLTNPNCEFESNFVAMHTVATWWKSFTPVLENSETVSVKGEQDCVSDSNRSVNEQEIKSNAVVVENPSLKKEHDLDNKSSNSFELSASDLESIGSGRASDTDSDSDYSSHEDEGYFFTLPDSEHGSYDPKSALEKALKDWLPVFSWLKYPSRKVVPRSGTPQVLPPIPHIPLNTRPVLPDVTVTTVTSEPVFSIGQMGEPPCKSTKSENEIKNSPETLESTVIAEASNLPVDMDKTITDSINSPINIQDENEKLSIKDLKPPNPCREPCDLKESSNIQPDVSLKKNFGPNKVFGDTHDEKNKDNSTPDVEMKEELTVSANDDKILEEMQTSPKNTNTVLDQMETEDLQEQTTPMITDDLDSDVSMATAQSGSAIPTDDDMLATSLAVNVSENKDSETPSKPLNDNSEKVQELPQTLIDSVTLMKTNRPKESILEKYELNPITIEDLRLLAECFYLPYEHGSVGIGMMQKFRWLHENAVKLSHISDKKSEDYLDKALAWSQKALAFEEHCRDVQSVFNKVCACPNRALLFDLFPYMWDLKGVVTMLRSYVRWLGQVEIKPQSQESNIEKHEEKVEQFSKSGFGFFGADPEPWAFRGGLSGDLQRLLPISSAFDLFCQTLPVEPQVCTTVVRPYVPTDEKSVYNLCFSSANEGRECAEEFKDFKNLPGDRIIGALLTLSPEYCFVAEDGNGLSAFLAAALDAGKFWKRYEVAYLPELLEKYQKPTESDSKMTEVEKIILDLHSSYDRYGYASDDMQKNHPSFVTLAIQAGTNSNILKSMLVCLLSALKSHRSCGIHTVVPDDSLFYIDLYSKLGLVKIAVNDESLCNKSVTILGRSF